MEHTRNADFSAVWTAKRIAVLRAKYPTGEPADVMAALNTAEPDMPPITVWRRVRAYAKQAKPEPIRRAVLATRSTPNDEAFAIFAREGRDLRDAGMSKAAIGTRYGVSANTIRAWLVKLGWDWDQPQRNAKRHIPHPSNILVGKAAERVRHVITVDVAAWIAANGVTKCPPAICAPSTARLAPNDAAIIREHNNRRAEWEAGSWKTRSKKQIGFLIVGHR